VKNPAADKCDNKCMDDFSQCEKDISRSVKRIAGMSIYSDVLD